MNLAGQISNLRWEMRIRSRATKSRWGPDENYGSTGCVWICNLLDMSAKKIQKESGRGKAKESECAEAKLVPWNASNRYQHKIKIGTSLQKKKNIKN